VQVGPEISNHCWLGSEEIIQAKSFSVNIFHSILNFRVFCLLPQDYPPLYGLNLLSERKTVQATQESSNEAGQGLAVQQEV